MVRSREYLVEIARKYYLEELSQQEIARDYQISRPTVSNILRQCRDEGIVEIRIQDGSLFTAALGDKLEKLFGLEQIIVVPSDNDYNLTLTRTGEAAARYFSGILADRIRIGISWGTALYQVIRQLPRTDVVDAQIVQLMGGLGASAPSYDGSELARILAEKLNGKYFPFQSPLLVQSPELKEMLLSEPGIKETMKMSSRLDAALVGLSSNNPEDSALVRAGFLSAREAQEIFEQGARGHLCGYHYDSAGNILDIPANKRIVGIPFSSFLKIPRRIGIACGRQKAQAIHAALKGGFLTTLITDEDAALQILSLESEGAGRLK